MQVLDEARKAQVLQALADDYSRKILASTIVVAKSVIDISREHNIPISTAYRRVHELLESGLLTIQRIIITDDGKKYEIYRSMVRNVTIQFERGAVQVFIEPNEDVVDKFTRLWGYVRVGKSGS